VTFGNALAGACPECGHAYGWHGGPLGCRALIADPAGRRDCKCSSNWMRREFDAARRQNESLPDWLKAKPNVPNVTNESPSRLESAPKAHQMTPMDTTREALWADVLEWADGVHGYAEKIRYDVQALIDFEVAATREAVKRELEEVHASTHVNGSEQVRAGIELGVAISNQLVAEADARVAAGVAEVERRIEALKTALVECAIVLEALHLAGGTGLTDEIEVAARYARFALGIGAGELHPEPNLAEPRSESRSSAASIDGAP
jgi:hypothetical protein